MTFLWTLIAITALLFLVTVANWWRDERMDLVDEKSPRPMKSFPDIVSLDTPRSALHPSIDPYLTELREYLLRTPLPQGPVEMVERVYAHLTLWANIHLTQEGQYVDRFEDDLLVGPIQRFVDMSRNEAAPPLGYLEELMKEG